MCKIHGYHYSCGHFIRYYLSRCRGNFTKLRKRRFKSFDGEQVRTAACIGECYIVIASRSPCGACLYEQFRLHWSTRIGEAENAYREALDRGLKMGLGLWGWGGRGWGGGGGGGHENEDGANGGGQYEWGNSSDEGASAEDRGREGAEGSVVDGGNADKKQNSEHGLREEIDYWGQHLADLRDQFSTESWIIRKQFPTIERRIPPGLKINRRVDPRPSPLRYEVLPEEVVIRERKQGWDDDSGNHHPTFQAFFVDRYGGVSGNSWVDCSGNGGSDWSAPSAGRFATTGSWDANIVANINLANALNNEQSDPTGDESYYTEYNRFDVSQPGEDDQGAEHTAATEDDVNSDANIKSGFKESIVAYGPETIFPPLMREEELLAPGPNMVPP